MSAAQHQQPTSPQAKRQELTNVNQEVAEFGTRLETSYKTPPSPQKSTTSKNMCYCNTIQL